MRVDKGLEVLEGLGEKMETTKQFPTSEKVRRKKCEK